MSLTSYRPRVAELRFQVLPRTVHPELFVTHKKHAIERDKYRALICINSDGHSITWQANDHSLTEIAASATQPVPAGRLVELPLHFQNSTSLNLPSCQYSYQFHLERVPAEMFWMIQKQLGELVSNHELIHVFNSSGRVPLGGLSYIHVESRLRSMQIQAIHTFPDDYTLVKTESTFRCSV